MDDPERRSVRRRKMQDLARLWNGKEDETLTNNDGRRMRFLHPLVLALAWVACAAQLYGQATYGSIMGTVTDAQGAVIPGATVTAVSEERGTEASAQTNASGNYSITQLLAGTYRVEIEASGFQRFVQEAVQAGVDRTTQVDATLSVGALTETITVTDAPPALQTDRAEVSTALSDYQVQNLPVFDRNLTTLQLLLPGSTKMGWQHASSENPQGGLQINNNGQEFGTTGFTIDGMENFDPVLGIIVINPSIDSVAEYKSASGNFDAEFAQAGGAQIQVTTKSGSNELHGSLFEFLRNNELNARDPFTQPVEPPPLRWNQFGGSLGGPIQKNKFFFFGDYQGTRRRTGASVLTTVPTALVRQGDFSEFADPIFDPLTGNEDGTGRLPFPGNRIPADRIDVPSRNLVNMLPLPTGPGTDNNFTTSGSEAFDSDQYNFRLDHYLTDDVRYFFRYTLADFRKLSPPAFGPQTGGPALGGLGFAGESDVQNQNIVGSVTYTISPNLLMEFRGGFTEYDVAVLPLDFGENTGEEVGIPGVNIPGREDTSGIPSFQIQGTGGWNQGFSLPVNQCNCPLDQREEVYQFLNKWTYLKGDHEFKWGMDFRHARNVRIPSDQKRNGQFVFSPTVTSSAELADQGLASGIGPATFMLGLPTGFGRFAQTTNDAQDAQNRLFLFVQDKWRATPKLTVSLGLRWDTWFPNYSVNEGQGSVYDVATNTVLVAGVGDISRSGNFETQWTNFSPRLSFAYQLNDKTVIRTGAGRSYYQEIFGWTFNYTANGFPTLIQQQLSQSNIFEGLFRLSNGPPPVVFPEIPPDGRLQLPDGVGVSYRPFDQGYSYVDSWNFSIERLIARDLTWTFSYVGNVGRNGRQAIPLNQAIPGPGPLNPRRVLYNKFGISQPISDLSTKGSNNYNSLQTKLNKRFSDGYSLLATYTWGKAINNINPPYAAAGHLGRGLADFDQAHVFTLGHTVELPFGPGKPFGSNARGFLRHLIEGWEFTGVTQLQSGRPFGPVLANNAPLNADATLRPDLAAGADPTGVPGGQTRELWFIPMGHPDSPWSVPAPFTFGTAGRTIMRGPGVATFDLALHKSFTIAEGKTLTVRWEAFNAFNRTNLGMPNSAVDTGPAGQITSLGGAGGIAMRRQQIGLRFDF